MRSVRFYFDFISPYASLALLEAPAFAEANSLRWLLRPVAYGALLSSHGLHGPAEVPAKRRYVFADVLRIARLRGLRLRFPPAHPFRSLEALRCVALFPDRPAQLSLAVSLARACWVDGRDLTRIEVLAELVDAAGLPADDLAARLRDTAVKGRLKEWTTELIVRGGFGVPSFVLGRQLFWGQDRMAHLQRALDGQLPDDFSALESILARPRGADRKSTQD